MRVLPLSPLFLLVTLGWAQAQPKPGDLLVSSFTGIPNMAVIQVIDRTTSGVTTLYQVSPAAAHVQGLTMAPDNRDVLAAALTTNTQPMTEIIARVSPTGRVSLFGHLGASGLANLPSHLQPDEDGSHVATLGSHLLRLAGSTVTTLVTLTGRQLMDVTVDPDTGDYIVTTTAPTDILRIDRNTQFVTTAVTFRGGLDLKSVVVDPASGDFIVSLYQSSLAPMVAVVDRTGKSLQLLPFPYPLNVQLDPETGRFLVLCSRSVVEVTRQWTYVRSYASPTQGDPISQFAIYGSHEVSGTGTGRRGSTYRLNLSFPRVGVGQPYLAALSLAGTRPGIQLPNGRIIHIAQDWLFGLTAVAGDIPGITQGLRGVLGPGGAAQATLRIPVGMPVGQRIYATAIAIDPQAPSGLDVANTWAFTVR